MNQKNKDDASDGDATPTLQDLRLAKSQGNQGLGSLLERYGCRVRQWIRAAGVRAEHDVDDLEGDVLVRLLEKLPATDFDSVAEFRKWVERVATNRTIDHLRRQGINPARRHRESLLTVGGSGLDPAAKQTGPLTRMSREERIRKRSALIAALPSPHRELIEMRERRSMAFAAIAEAQNEKARAMGIAKTRTEDAVRVAYSRLLEKVGQPVEG